jgi:glutamine cyclotransferase
MSDGSDILLFSDPESNSLQGGLPVTASGDLIKGLNEPGHVRGEIYANLWPSS